jgi:hypothetical protein
MGSQQRMFNEQTLLSEIERVFGRYGAHYEVAEMLVRQQQRSDVSPVVSLPCTDNTPSGLVEALRQIEQMSDCGSYATTVIRMKQIASKALTTLPATPVGQRGWISVEDELPPPHEEVLVWRKNYTDVPVQALRKPNGEWRGSIELRDCMKDGWTEDAELDFTPTHWQPLPHPPQGIIVGKDGPEASNSD